MRVAGKHTVIWPSGEAQASVAKFACIALRSPSVELRGTPLRIDLGLSVHDALPFEVDEIWTRWLGTEGIRAAVNSDCSILATSASSDESILGAEHETLKSQVFQLFYCMLLNGIPHIDGGLLLLGVARAGDVTVSQVSALPDLYRLPGVFPATVTDESMLEAGAMAGALRAIYEKTGQYVRIKRGFHALLGGMREAYGGERLHECVRSVEALMRPPKSRTRAAFMRCGQTLAGSRAQAVLGELYDLRSQAEHMNPLHLSLTHRKIKDEMKLAAFRAYQAELLARNAYKRLLAGATTLEWFRDDDRIAAFWALEDERRAELWGEAIDLDRVAWQQFGGSS